MCSSGSCNEWLVGIKSRRHISLVRPSLYCMVGCSFSYLDPLSSWSFILGQFEEIEFFISSLVSLDCRSCHIVPSCSCLLPFILVFFMILQRMIDMENLDDIISLVRPSLHCMAGCSFSYSDPSSFWSFTLGLKKLDSL